MHGFDKQNFVLSRSMEEVMGAPNIAVTWIEVPEGPHISTSCHQHYNHTYHHQHVKNEPADVSSIRHSFYKSRSGCLACQ